ncbi:hypothetical protein G6514_007675 [Epicoccum nigrum]|nr:hypothetical protein G6514_007675 [Epicoccum nigrum]
MPLPQTPPHTPSITTAAAHKLATEIYDIYHSLINLPNLKPGNEVNVLLTRLVDLCIETYDRDFVADFFNVGGIHAICSQLRSLCATAEGELESFWAQKLILESLKYNARVHNIDRDPSALSISQSLSERFGYADRMSFACTDVSTKASEFEGKTVWHEFDVVFLAALVGMDATSKLAILEDLVKKLRSGALIVARSAKGLRMVLYPMLELGEDLERIGLEILVELHPWNRVVNSVIVLRVKNR